MLRQIAFVAAVAAVPLFNSARADTLGLANDFNVFVLHDMTQSNTDAQGRVAVGNNLTLSSYSVASKLPGGSAKNLIVGGTFTQTGGTVRGSAIVRGNASLTNATVSGNFASGANLTQTGGSVSGSVVTKGNYSVTNSGPGSAIVGGNFSQTGGYIPGNVTVAGNATLNNGAGGGGHYQVNGNLTANNPGYVSGGATHAGSFTGPTWFHQTSGPAIPSGIVWKNDIQRVHDGLTADRIAGGLCGFGRFGAASTTGDPRTKQGVGNFRPFFSPPVCGPDALSPASSHAPVS